MPKHLWTLLTALSLLLLIVACTPPQSTGTAPPPVTPVAPSTVAPAPTPAAPVIAVTPEEFGAAVLKEPVAIVDFNADGKMESVMIQEGQVLVLSSDGHTLHESDHWGKTAGGYAQFRFQELALPGGQPLIAISRFLMCFKGGPSTIFLWYDAETARIRVTPEDGVADCKIYAYKGDGRFEVYQSHNDGPFSYTDDAHWQNGQFVTEKRQYELLLGSVTRESLYKVLTQVAEGSLDGEPIFASPELLRQFRAKTGPGTWAFTRDSAEQKPIRYRVTVDDKPKGFLTIQTVRQSRPVIVTAYDAVMISDLQWSD